MRRVMWTVVNVQRRSGHAVTFSAACQRRQINASTVQQLGLLSTSSTVHQAQNKVIVKMVTDVAMRYGVYSLQTETVALTVAQ